MPAIIFSCGNVEKEEFHKIKSLDNVKDTLSNIDVKNQEEEIELYSSINFEINLEYHLKPELSEIVKGLFGGDSVEIVDFEGKYYGYENSERKFIVNGPLEGTFEYKENAEEKYTTYGYVKGFIYKNKKEGDFTTNIVETADGDGDYVAVSGSGQEFLTFRNDSCVFIRYWEFGEGSYYSDAIENPNNGVYGYLQYQRYK